MQSNFLMTLSLYIWISAATGGITAKMDNMHVNMTGTPDPDSLHTTFVQLGPPDQKL